MSAGKRQDPRLRQDRIVWAALAASVVLYFVLTLVRGPAGVAANANADNIERVLMVLSAAYVLLSIPARRWLRAQADAVDSALLRNLAFLVPLILCQAAALTGLVLRFAAGSSHYYVFLLLALGGMLLHFPRRSAVTKPDSGS